MSEQIDPQLQVAAPEHVANDVTEATPLRLLLPNSLLKKK